MAGCFGNNFFDRSMESQLMRHLDEESAYEDWYIRASEQVPDDVWNSKCINEKGQEVPIVEKTLDRLFAKDYDPETAGRILVRLINSKL